LDNGVFKGSPISPLIRGKPEPRPLKREIERDFQPFGGKRLLYPKQVGDHGLCIVMLERSEASQRGAHNPDFALSFVTLSSQGGCSPYETGT